MNFTSINQQWAKHKDAILAEIDNYISGGNVMDQTPCLAFEQSWMTRLNSAQHGVFCANGTSALELAFRKFVLPGRTVVLIPDHAFIADLQVLRQHNPNIVVVESDKNSLQMNTDDLIEKLYDIDRGLNVDRIIILLVHMHGWSCDIEEIEHIQQQDDRIIVIEDCSQAHAARYKEHYLGTKFDAACWSFYPTKTLGAFGEAGLVSFKEKAHAIETRAYINFGWIRNEQRFFNTNGQILGTNLKGDMLQCVILNWKLKNTFEQSLVHRDNLAEYYFDNIRADLLPIIPAYALPSWYDFPIYNKFKDPLQIPTEFHYRYTLGQLQNGNSKFPNLISIPMHEYITLEEAKEIVAEVNKCASL